MIVTLTLNPALDVSTSVDHIEPWRKLRCDVPHHDPGGGGINVARAALALGAEATAVVAVGGEVGSLVEAQLAALRVPSISIHVDHDTRQCFLVTERSSGAQYRFILPGGALTADEWERCSSAAVGTAAGASCLVISSSLPPGISEDTFAALVRRVEPLGVPIIVDTPGPGLHAVLAEPVALVKPSLHELGDLVGRELVDDDDCIVAARQLLDRGRCEVMVVSLGARGCIVVPRDGDAFAVAAPEVQVVSTSGAGDSMIAGIAVGFSRGLGLRDAVRLGVAAGSTSVLNHGTELCRMADVEQLLARMPSST